MSIINLSYKVEGFLKIYDPNNHEVFVDKKNATANNYTHVIGSDSKDFKVNLKVDNLKMLPGNYDVSISSKKISQFKSKDIDLTYYVAVEADSDFNL